MKTNNYKQLLLLLLCYFNYLNITITQSDSYWDKTFNAGLDLSSLLQINPKVGGGESQLGFGGALSFLANYEETRLSWTNSISLNIGVQKVGFGNTNIENPLQKSIDQFRVNSRLSYAAGLLLPKSNFKYTADFSFLSQFTKTYPGNFLSEPDPSLVNGSSTSAISKFLSPGQLTFSLGLDYEPTDQFSIYYSPAALKVVMVLDDDIADSLAIINNDPTFCSGRGLHGNPIDCTTRLVSNSDVQLGSQLKLRYIDNFPNSRISIRSELSLYSNYLNQPEKIDVDWVNELSLTIFDGLQLSLWTNLFYDYDIPVQKTENLQIIENTLVRGVSFTQQILLRYTAEF